MPVSPFAARQEVIRRLSVTGALAHAKSASPSPFRHPAARRLYRLSASSCASESRYRYVARCALPGRRYRVCSGSRSSSPIAPACPARAIGIAHSLCHRVSGPLVDLNQLHPLTDERSAHTAAASSAAGQRDQVAKRPTSRQAAYGRGLCLSTSSRSITHAPRLAVGGGHRDGRPSLAPNTVESPPTPPASPVVASTSALGKRRRLRIPGTPPSSSDAPDVPSHGPLTQKRPVRDRLCEAAA